MVTWHNEGIDLLGEANDALIVLAASFIDIMKLGDHPIDLKFFQKDLPMFFANIFNCIFCFFVCVETDYSQNNVTPAHFTHTIQRVFFLVFYFFSRGKHIFIENRTVDSHCDL